MTTKPRTTEDGVTIDAYLEDLLRPLSLNSKKDGKGRAPSPYSVQLIETPMRNPRPRTIASLEMLSNALPSIVSNIHKAIGSQQNEATYQRCLKLDLEAAGLSVELEVVLPLMYKSHEVGTRRADLIVYIPSSSERCVLETKAVSRDLSPRDMQQLQYYLVHYQATHGYLINFPHDDSFPYTDPCFDFDYQVLSGDVTEAAVRPRRLRLSNRTKDVQIVAVTVQKLRGASLHAATEIANMEQTAVWGINASNLQPCKTCIRYQGYCKQHKDQDPRN